MNISGGHFSQTAGKCRRLYACRRRIVFGDCEQRSVSSSHIEEDVVAEVVDVFRDGDLLRNVWRAAVSLLEGIATAPEIELARIAEARAEANASLARCRAPLGRGPSGLGSGQELAAVLKTRLARLKRQERQAAAVLARLRSPVLDGKAMSEYVQRLEESLADDDVSGKRLHLHEVVKQMELRKTERIDVRYRLPEALVLGNVRAGRASKHGGSHRGLFSFPEIRFDVRYDGASLEGIHAQKVEVSVHLGGERGGVGPRTVRRSLTGDPPLAVFLREWRPVMPYAPPPVSPEA